MFTGIALIVLSLLAVPSLIAGKSPQAAEGLKKLAPFQGWIGFIGALWSIWGVIGAIMTIGWLIPGGLLGWYPLWWATNTAGTLITLILGILLGYGLIQSILLKNASEEVKAKADENFKKLSANQATFGIIGVIVGIWTTLYNVFIYRITGL